MTLPLALIQSNEAQRRYFAESHDGRRAEPGKRKLRRRRPARID